jgi:hypothetical protein
MAEPTASPVDQSLEERLRLIETLLLRLLANEPALRSSSDQSNLVPTQSFAPEILTLTRELQELKAVVQALPNWVVFQIDEHKAAIASLVSQSSDDFRRLRLDTAEALQLLALNNAVAAPKKKLREADLAGRRRVQKRTRRVGQRGRLAEHYTRINEPNGHDADSGNPR